MFHRFVIFYRSLNISNNFGDGQNLKKFVNEYDENYKYALVGSPSLDYLWILSRTKTLDKTVLENLQSTATKQGFQIDRLEFIDQGCN